MKSSIIRFGELKNAIKYRIYLCKGLRLHIVFFISIFLKASLGSNLEKISII